MKVSEKALHKMTKKELIEAMLEQGGSEKAPLWEIRSLVDYKLFFHEDAEKDIVLEAKGTATIPEEMKGTRDIQKAVQGGLISEPYRVDEPTPAKIMPNPPSYLELGDSRAKEAVRNILACNEVGVQFIQWGADIEPKDLTRSDRQIMRERLLPIWRLADWYDKQIPSMSVEYRTALRERIKQVEAF